LLPFSPESSVQETKFKIFRTTISPVVFCGCETWSHALWEEHRLKVSENRVLRRINGPERKEGAEGWIRLHNEKLHNLYASPNT
jgi:hypothetical protein